MRRYLIEVSLMATLCLWLNGWGIISEGRKPHERPDWWKPYENAAPIQPAPQVVPPQGGVPTVVEEAVTRSAPAGVPETLVVQPQSGGAASRLPTTIDGMQVMEQATREIEHQRRALWQPFALFGGFLLLGGGAVFGLLRWLSQQVPEPPRTRRRRY
ncbi:MAG: hypothetical protein ABDI19_08210 [Armatimonadota bacterium]